MNNVKITLLQMTAVDLTFLQFISRNVTQSMICSGERWFDVYITALN